MARYVMEDEAPTPQGRYVIEEQPGSNIRPWSSVPFEAVGNIPSSAVNFAKGIYQSVRHPVDTGEALIKAGAGAVRNMIPEQYQSQRHEAIEASKTADAIGQFYKDRYGSMEGFKNAVATDPVGVLSDASALLSVGAAIAPKAGKLEGILKAGASATNPVGLAATAAQKMLNPTARFLMNSAVKPLAKAHKTGDAQIAVDTLLKYGISPTERGVDKLQSVLDDLNQQIAGKIAVSGAGKSVSRENVMRALEDTRKKFTAQVNPTADLNAIQQVGDEFASHPYFQQVEAKGQALQDALDKARKGKVQALQAAGKLKTFAAQQENLAHIERVPEGLSGYADAMKAYAAAKRAEAAAQNALDKWNATRGNLPVDVAQQIKQGTYKVLKGKYGEVGSASTEAQKALARGLKENIAQVVPGIGALNAEESRLLKTLSVTERRALMDMNKNPLGLAALAGNPTGFAAFMADRSAAFKALVARIANRTAQGAQFTSNNLATPAVASGLLGNAVQNDQR